MTSVDPVGTPATAPDTGSPVPDAGPPRGFLGRSRTFAGVSPMTIGIAWLWLSIIVLLPLAAITVQSFDDGWSGFWEAISAPVAVDAIWITVLVSAVAALINVVFGTLIAWVLVRDEFPGKGFVNAIIDLPFALPTIVASLVLLSLYGPNSPIDIQLNATKPALVIALTFVTLPFVVRQVQPVLIELDVDVEEAAAVLGANNATIFRKIILPALLPAILTGAGLAFTRAIGEFGSVVLIGGNIPGDTQVASQYIQQQVEIDAPVDAAAISVVLLLIAFVTLLVLRVAGRWQSKREDADR
ncbi:sulfate ABC transporter permease subunit CysT [Gordonia amicalis]|uniref:sulfate ABC transporter permease subunit CysT n=1 Tax=Gordonia amicalis TaxID=89053 RepID=UPI0002A65E94|nr:sulfate ABC transporter permease subunit CysT [Gordonia amicalis]MBA5849413.1 sulfate ABC transporter permease subunit CysT [Gordonia amicalis]MDV7099776.1 sulfate ABC transporter permease subunit CysT [Gordonia amicalis]MDV7171867.1 sulfate ABC transporter permease subunit CysT [Gordonia amicalis]NKX78586.1 sulfate ABC transporter permease subunit CysT [Gordonia amicalis]GAC51833.1 sulfate ABC transporter permease protein [Gordonia amicalis NBRC 100051 = JCM 11271]